MGATTLTITTDGIIPIITTVITIPTECGNMAAGITIKDI
jgi:hypothetical protein